MGIDSYVIGETVTPNFEKEDILIIGSGSGETKSLVSMAEKAKSIGGKIATVMIFPDSTIGQLADITIKLPGSPKTNQRAIIKPSNQWAHYLSRPWEKKGLDTNKMYGRHANLE